MKARHQACDKFGGKIVMIGSVLSFESVAELKNHYRSYLKWFEPHEIGKGDSILFPDKTFASDSTVSIHGENVAVGSPVNYVSKTISDWEERLTLAEACQSVYEANQEWSPRQILEEAEKIIL